MIYNSTFDNLEPVEAIKLAIDCGYYDVDNAIETLSEKLVLMKELGMEDQFLNK
jgi:hypothetical protein